MNFKERLKLFALGSLGGILLVTLFFGNRTSCKDSIVNYFPEGRVKQEILFYDIDYSSQAKEKLTRLNINDSIFRNYIKKSDVDFDLSQPRNKPCGKYILFSADSIQNLEIRLEKCKGSVLINEVKTTTLND